MWAREVCRVERWLERELDRCLSVRQKPKLIPDYPLNGLLWVGGKVDVIRGQVC